MAGFVVNSIICALTVLVIRFGGVAAMRKMKNPDKHDYTIEIKNAVVDVISSDFFDEDTFFTNSLFNDTAMTVNSVLNFKQDLPADVMVTFVGSTMNTMTNQWVEKFRQTYVLCEFLETNTYYANNADKVTNFPRTCPITKGSYYIKNVMIDNSEFPKHLEESDWRTDNNLFLPATNEPILKVSVYAKVEPIDEDE